MIFVKGEFVEISNSCSKFHGQIGQIQKVYSIDRNSFPYEIIFYSGGLKFKDEFNAKELKLVDTFDGEERKQSYFNEVKMYNLQKKV